MSLYVKKPITIEASQFHALGDHPQVVADTVQGFVVEGRQGSVRVDPGDWILPELNGQGFYPCKPDVFETTYQPVESSGTSGLSFGDALVALKDGEAVARDGWNGKAMFLLLVPGSQGLTVEAGRPLANAGIPVGTRFDYLPHIDMWTAQGAFVPWLASQTDVLAEDWCVVRREMAGA